MEGGLIGGLIQGFVQRKGEIEQENLRQADLAQQRETDVYKALLASPNPEIQAMAASALVEGTQPKSRKSGLQGWMGERQSSPTFQRIMQYIQTPDQVQETVPGPSTLPSKLTTWGQPLAPATQPPQLLEEPPGSAGMSGNQTVRPGGAPPTPVAVGQAPAEQAQAGAPPAPQAAATAPVSMVSPPTPQTITRLVSRPKQVFLSPQQKLELEASLPGMELTNKAAAIGRVMDQYGASPDAKQRAVLMGLGILPRTPAMIAHPGGDATGSIILGQNPSAADSMGQPIDPNRTYRRMIDLTNPDPLSRESYTPITTPPGQQGHFQTLAVDAQGIPTSDPTGRPAIFRVFPDGRKALIGYKPVGAIGQNEALTLASQLLPNGSLDERMALADTLLTQNAPTGGGPAAPAASGAPPAPTGGTTAPSPSPTGPSATPPAGTPPAPTSLRDRVNATLPESATSSRTPMSQDAKNTIEQIDNVIGQAQKAIGALDAEGFRGDDPAQTAQKFTGYLSGQKGNDGAAQIAQLLNFIRVVGAQPYMRGNRSIRWVDEIQAHLPRVPQGPWEARIGSKIPGQWSSPVASLLTHSEGYDSPDLIREKLQNLPIFLQTIKDQIVATEGSAPSHRVAPGGAPPPPAQAGQAYKDDQGVWRVR